jgi:hypothetical protein
MQTDNMKAIWNLYLAFGLMAVTSELTGAAWEILYR